MKVDQDGNELITTYSYKTNFIDSEIFIASSLSNLFDSLAERIYKIRCKYFNCFLE